MAETIPVRGFDILPPELFIAITDFLDSPRDILSLISASPAALRLFESNRRKALHSTVTSIQNQLGGDPLIPLAIFAARLRMANHKYHDLDINSAKEKMEPILTSMWPWSQSTEQFPWKENLLWLISLTSLLSDVQTALSEYAPQFWEKSGSYERTSWVSCPQSESELSTSERLRFVDSFLRFDSYCHAYLHCSNPRRPYDNSRQQRLFSPFLHGISKREAFLQSLMLMPFRYNIFEFIQDGHEVLMLSVEDSLRARTDIQQPQPEDAQVRSIMKQARPAGPSARDWVKRQLQICRFQNKSRKDQKRYLHHLCMQGYPLLAYFQKLDAQALEDFTLETFFNVTFLPTWDSTTPQLDHYRKIITRWDANMLFWDSSRLNFVILG
ncbi:hypothetical protein FDECE_6233 [Fusarium decemcellulare]|nr:hypothetical protein FDECE_6233 [Fusarium decemcellulare]